MTGKLVNGEPTYGDFFDLALAHCARCGAGAVGGGGKLSKLMGDAGKGINAFKKGLKENAKEADSEEKPEVAAQQSIEEDATEEKDKKAASG